MKVEGVNLLTKLKVMHDDIDEDVDFILKNNTNEGVELAIKMLNKHLLKVIGLVI